MEECSKMRRLYISV